MTSKMEDSSHDPENLDIAFVSQYYCLLRQSPKDVYKFYKDCSSLSRPGPDGETTMEAINEKIISVGYENYEIIILTIDSQQTFNGGIIVMVTGILRKEDNIKMEFSQMFLLARQDLGFFVLNDIFRFLNQCSDNVVQSAPESPKTPDHVETKEGCKSDQFIENEINSSVDSSDQADHVLENGKASADENENAQSMESLDGATDHLSENGKESADENENAPSVKISDVNGATDPDRVSENGKESTDDNENAQSVKNSDVDGATDRDCVSENGKESADENENAQSVKLSGVDRATDRVSENGKELEDENENAESVKISDEVRAADRVSENGKESADENERAKTFASVVSKLNANAAPFQIRASPAQIPSLVKKKISMAVKAHAIFVPNLPLSATVEELEKAFRKFGSIRPNGIQIRGNKNQGSCFGFVEFESTTSMQSALKIESFSLKKDDQTTIGVRRISVRVVALQGMPKDTSGPRLFRVGHESTASVGGNTK